MAYLFLDVQLEWTYARPWFACMMLIITGVLLGLTMLARSQGAQVTLWKSLFMGSAQAVSFFRGCPGREPLSVPGFCSVLNLKLLRTFRSLWFYLLFLERR